MNKPTFVQLKRIAKVYRIHVSIFYLPEPPASFESLTDYRRFPESHTPGAEQTYRLNANIIEAYERQATLIEFYELLGESPPQMTLKLNEDNTPKNTAQKIREFLQFNTGLLQQCNDDRSALKLWRRIVEAKGILVCQTSVNSHLSKTNEGRNQQFISRSMGNCASDAISRWDYRHRRTTSR